MENTMQNKMQNRPFSSAEPLEVFAIEAEARRLRAAAAADLVRRLGRWIAARLGRGTAPAPVARGA
jgi:hypothetical protein